ncbi:AI-2E family transporter [Peptoniphilus stercorisuis]|uniref:PurR-regulated permease PerM n=1 Tax=Peptoniphilus stercorisuis TaxID=1436965 RepID=A0ABS4KED8_9FIRM|nr:AI-2E family transporter [Peptoniphilus stercorisuis]MBP2026140.1 putative PurR-regulated permease PerM [Peptoniphilus stercorisuis]
MRTYIDYLREVLNMSSIGIKGYIKAQIKLMIITFLILSIGLYFIGIDKFILKAFGIAIVDIFPVLGSGIVMIPWAISFFVRNSINTGVYIILLYISLVIIRQIIEPKILGDSIGLRPIYTLAATILGSLFLGPFGVILGPIVAIILNSIYTINKREDIKNLENK